MVYESYTIEYVKLGMLLSTPSIVMLMCQNVHTFDSESLKVELILVYRTSIVLTLNLNPYRRTLRQETEM